MNAEDGCKTNITAICCQNKGQDGIDTKIITMKEAQPVYYWQMTNEPFLGQPVPRKPLVQQPTGSIVVPFLTGE